MVTYSLTYSKNSGPKGGRKGKQGRNTTSTRKNQIIRFEAQHKI